MEWNLEVAPHFKALEQVEDQTGKTPAMLLRQPDLHTMIVWVWEAFGVLDKGRQWGYNGPQPILVSEIEAYCRLKYISERSALINYIQAMDGVYLAQHREKLETKYGGRAKSRS